MKIFPIVEPDPTLFREQWLTLIMEDSDSEPSTTAFNPIYRSALAQARNFPEIDIQFPYAWDKFPAVLTALGFSRIITHYQISLPTPTGIRHPVKPGPASIEPLLPLLRQQAEFHHRLYPDYYKSWSQIDLPRYQSLYQHYLTDPHFASLYLQSNDQIIGFILGELNGPDTNIREVIVDENHRRQGIATSLVHSFLALCHHRQIPAVSVETGYNQPANLLYQKLSFTLAAQTWYKNL